MHRPARTLPPPRRSATLLLLCVHPHPDDEAIACGGVLARYAAEGLGTHVVTCTGGEAGENLAGIDLGDRELAEHRRHEMEAAVLALGIGGHTWLGYRDSGMAGTDDNAHPEAFVNADLDEAGGRLATLIRRLRPEVVVSDDANGTYGHPDHVQAHRVTERALELAADAGWDDGQPPFEVAKRYVHALSRTRMLTVHALLLARGLASPFGDGPLDLDALPFGVDDDAITATIQVGEYQDRKAAAMRAHATQIAADSFFLNFPPELLAEGHGVEEFTLLRGTAAPGDDGREHDLFAGLR